MNPVTLTPDDVRGFVTGDDEANLVIMCADVAGLALSVAPCLRGEVELPDYITAAARGVMRGAVIRWSQAKQGAVQQRQAGSFMETIDTTVRRSGLLSPSEIVQLRDLCKEVAGSSGRLYSFSRLPPMPDRGQW